MIHAAGIDFNSLPDEGWTRFGPFHGCGRHFCQHRRRDGSGLAHGLRDRHGQPLPVANLHVAPVAGLKGVKETSLTIEGTVPEWSFLEGVTLNVAVAHGLSNAQRLIEAVERGEASYHFVEVMTCPGGCIGGGGQRRLHRQPDPPVPHRGHLSRGRGQASPQVAREPRRAAALRRIPRPAPGRPLAPSAAHQVHAQRADVNFGVR